ncbi:MAG: hypothetical protein CMJ48_03430 [Planctomycetaceae bacterium]|nr:hypothetical protein [Planctomycetaceae bacterium]
MRKSLCWLLLVLTGGIATARAEEGPSKTARRVAARRVMALVDRVMQHHVAPPTRQQLVYEAARAAYAQRKAEPPGDLSVRVSGLSSSVEFETFLTGVWDELQVHEVSGTFVTRTLRSLAELPSVGGRLVAAPDEKLERQLAANRYVGVGIALSLKGKVPVMHQVFEGGPVHRAGAQDGDAIIEVDGVATNGKSLSDIVKLLRGPSGSKVELLLSRGQDSRAYEVTRGVVRIPSVKHTIDESSGVPIAHVTLAGIKTSTPQELQKIDELVQRGAVKAVVLDWRHRADFNLHHGILLADALLDGSEIGSVQTRRDRRSHEARRDCLFRDTPLVVLVNAGTGGTLEWITAALQDSKRAKIIGLPTSGTGIVSSSLAIPETGQVLVLPTGRLHGTNGRSLLATGVVATSLLPRVDSRPPRRVVSQGTSFGRDTAPKRLEESRLEQPDGKSTPANRESPRNSYKQHSKDPQLAEAIATLHALVNKKSKSDNANPKP